MCIHIFIIGTNRNTPKFSLETPTEVDSNKSNEKYCIFPESWAFHLAWLNGEPVTCVHVGESPQALRRSDKHSSLVLPSIDTCVTVISAPLKTQSSCLTFPQLLSHVELCTYLEGFFLDHDSPCML